MCKEEIMQFYPEYQQSDDAEVRRLLNTCPTALLVTAGGGFGVFNPVLVGDSIYLHLNRADEQIRELRVEPRATLVFQDILATIPSHWVDPAYGGAATQYYRFAQLTCDVALLEDPEAMQAPLQAMLDRFQPEGGYAALRHDHKLYRGSFLELVVLALTPVATRTKWKLGQNRSAETRRSVVARLRERGTPVDLRTAAEVERVLVAAEKCQP